MPLRPIPFLSSFFFCAWFQFIELAVAVAQPCFFPFAFSLLFSFSLVSVLAFFLECFSYLTKCRVANSAAWILCSHELEKKRIAQRKSAHEKWLRNGHSMFKFHCLFSAFALLLQDYSGLAYRTIQHQDDGVGSVFGFWFFFTAIERERENIIYKIEFWIWGT